MARKQQRGRGWPRLVWVIVVLVVALLGTLSSVYTASNTVPTTNRLDQQNNPTVQTLGPTACNAIAPTIVLSGNGALTSTNTSTLIMGGPAAQTLTGRNGNDCILGGDGNDSLIGGAGTDVCIGQGGTDTFNANCETQTQ